MRLPLLSTPVILVFLTFWFSDGSVRAQPNYDPPGPSPAFGTPDATAKIAAKAGFLDVVGVKLGLPLKAAVEAVKAHNANLKLEPQYKLEFEALPGTVMMPVLQAPNPGRPSATRGDDFHRVRTYAPNEAFVWGIVRNMGFGRVEDRPTVENTLAGLRQKYGPESTRQPGGDRLIWICDAHGQQVMG